MPVSSICRLMRFTVLRSPWRWAMAYSRPSSAICGLAGVSLLLRLKKPMSDALPCLGGAVDGVAESAGGRQDRNGGAGHDLNDEGDDQQHRDRPRNDDQRQHNRTRVGAGRFLHDHDTSHVGAGREPPVDVSGDVTGAKLVLGELHGGVLLSGAAVGAGGEFGRRAVAVLGGEAALWGCTGGGVTGLATAVVERADPHGSDADHVVEAVRAHLVTSFQASWATIAPARSSGMPRRARRVAVSMSVPVRVRCSVATLRAWSTRAGGTTGTEAGAGASGRAGTGSAGAISGPSSATSGRSMTGGGSEGAAGAGAGAPVGSSWVGWWTRRGPPRKASAGQPATRVRSHAGTWAM